MRVFFLRAVVSRGLVSLAALGSAAILTGCYVVPLNQAPGYVGTVPVPITAAPGPITFPARLYPANDLARGYGMVSAIVTNDLNGRGTFNTVIDGESFSGEATRNSTSARDGIANGAGNRGSYLQCTYKMNNATLGTGTCRLSNGALFTMHVGN
ncbi:hypothetical protein [Rhodoferax saidenbachensis]|jgi:hypothetical protein|uniref:Lipoprotein n=1 Tax=Rhodoferax saidenbachensis TaxID=1484693 RepID=A0ABU1ZS05_9BURK|nr:hypothetical protein [Rhodoferax saidenbachensis]MDR7307336.1 hypothetical protein [Rhodoferax saidenbachensis]